MNQQEQQRKAEAPPKENILSPNHRPLAVRRRPNKKLMHALRVSMVISGILIALCGILLMVLPLFRVQKIEITGNSIHTTEEILNAAGIQEGEDEVLEVLSDGNAIIKRIKEACPYIKSAKVVVYPFSVKIEVAEYEDVRVASFGDRLFSFNRDFCVLEIVDGGGSGSSPFPYVHLPSFGSVTRGAALNFTGGLDGAYINSFYDFLKENGLIGNVTEMNCESRFSLSCIFNERLQVRFGKLDADAKEKVTLLRAILEEKRQDGIDLSEVYAILDLSNPSSPTWREVADASAFD